MSIDADRVAFECAFPLAVWDKEVQGYTDPMYTYALVGWKHALSHERARRAEACADLIVEAERRAVTLDLKEYRGTAEIIRRLVEALK